MSDRKEISRLQYLITRAGKGSFALGVLMLIFTPIYIWGLQMANTDYLIIGMVIGIYFIWLGKRIEKSNSNLRAKLWILLISSLVLSSGIIPIIVFVQAIIALNSLHKLKKLDEQALRSRVETHILHKNLNSRNTGDPSALHRNDRESANQIQSQYTYDEHSKAKIEIIKLGFKKVNHLMISQADIEKLPEKEVIRYYNVGMKELKK